MLARHMLTDHVGSNKKNMGQRIKRKDSYPVMTREKKYF